MDNRTERITVETDRYKISGDLTLPKEGYRSRVSDYLNIGDLAFLPLVDVEVIPLGGGETERRQFMAVGRAHIHVVYPTPEDGVGPG